MIDKPFDYKFELRIYEGQERDPTKAIAVIPFTQKGRWIPAHTKALAMARRLWTILEYPTAENVEKATGFFEQATIDVVFDLAEEVEPLPKTYGILVALMLPAAGMAQKNLFEFVRYRPGEAIPSGPWTQYTAENVLKK